MSTNIIPPPHDLQQLGFVAPSPTIRKRLLVAIDGPPRGGKTTFGLYAPGPVALFDYDLGAEGPLQEALAKGRVIWPCGFRGMLPMTTDPALANTELSNVAYELWQRTRVAWQTCLSHRQVRTIFVDNAGIMFTTFLLAKFGKVQQIPTLERGRANDEFYSFLMEAEKYDKNVIWSHQMADEYVNNERTGKLKRKGFAGLKYIAQVNMTVWKDEASKQFCSQVVDNRLRMDMQGLVFPNQQWPIPLDFAGLAQWCFPGSRPEEWS